MFRQLEAAEAEEMALIAVLHTREAAVVEAVELQQHLHIPMLHNRLQLVQREETLLLEEQQVLEQLHLLVAEALVVAVEQELLLLEALLEQTEVMVVAALVAEELTDLQVRL
jgi:hypothetical protein